MPLPLLLIGIAAAAAATTAAVVAATSDDDESIDRENSRNRQDALRRARREEAERQMRARRESIRSDAKKELQRIADRHDTLGRKVAPRITFRMLEGAITGLDTALDLDAALNLLMPMSVPPINRDPEAREIRALSKEIRVLEEFSSAVSDLVSLLDAKKSFSQGAHRIRKLERELSALGSEVDDASHGISQSVDRLVRLASVELQSPVRLVACGLLCAGKSSLLNALIDQHSPECFGTGGGRTTRDCKAYIARFADDDCRFVDTPGLDADDSDDETAAKEVRARSLKSHVNQCIL